MSASATSRIVRASADALAIIVGFAISFVARDWSIQMSLLRGEPVALVMHAQIALLLIAITLVVFWRLGLYERRASVLNLWELRTALKGMMLASAYLFATLFLVRFSGFSRLVIAGAIVLSTVLVIAARKVLTALVHRLHARGKLSDRVLIFGAGPTGRLLMKKIVQAPNLGWELVGFLDDSAPLGSKIACRVTQTRGTLFETRVLGRWHQWRQVVEETDADELLICTTLASEQTQEILQAASELSLRVGIVPQLEDSRVDAFRVEDLSAIPVLRPLRPSARRSYHMVKRAFDLGGALVLLLCSSPLWVLISVSVWLDDRGAIFFRQERIGVGGSRFRMFKFRSMRSTANPYASSPHGHLDARVTRVGRLLRMTGLDELPQLLNVLNGDMSLVGPRPEMPFIVERYGPLERQRLAVTPGITGLWQLSADRHAEIHHNLEYDLYYINHQSMALDVLILAETAIFTLGLLLRLPWRVRRGAETPSGAPSLLVEPRRSFSILVALDQRHTTVSSLSWQTVIPLAAAMADRVPVRILVTREGVAEMDRVLDEVRGAPHGTTGRPEYVIHQSRAQVAALVHEAILVMTDLAFIATWADIAGAGVALFDGDEMQLRSGARCDESMLALVRDSLTDISIARATAPRSKSESTPMLRSVDVGKTALRRGQQARA